MALDTKPVLAVDMDDTVKVFTGPCVEYYNTTYGGTLDVTTMSRYFDVEEMGCDYEEAVRRVMSYHDSGESLYAAPIPEAVEDVPELAEEFDVHIVTARQDRLRDITLDWLGQYFGDHITDVHFANHHSSESDGRTKLSICRQIGAIGLVDDTGSHIQQMAENGMLGFLLGRYAWNRAVPAHPNIIPVDRLRDVSSFFRKLKAGAS